MNKLKKLENILNGYGQMLVALSGGVDSAFLLVFAHKLWHDDRVAALTADGPHFAADEVNYARTLCDNLGISHKTLDMSNVLPIIEDNPQDRCYHCKKEIFSIMKMRADMVGSVLADGTNLDDMADYRPGYQALQELNVASPLKEAGLTKAEIREALREIASEDELLAAALMVQQVVTTPKFENEKGAQENFAQTDLIPLWKKPAFACLASRIPYGEKITEERLAAIYDAEVFLRSLGFQQVRVRHHGDVARIEVLPTDRDKFFDCNFMDKINKGVKKCGFKFAALDLGGYRMGSLNKLGSANHAKTPQGEYLK